MKHKKLSKEIYVYWRHYERRTKKDFQIEFKEFESIFNDVMKILDELCKSNDIIREDLKRLKVDYDKEGLVDETSSCLLIAVEAGLLVSQALKIGRTRNELNIIHEMFQDEEGPGYMFYDLYDKYSGTGNKLIGSGKEVSSWVDRISEKEITALRRSLIKFRKKAKIIFSAAKKIYKYRKRKMGVTDASVY